MRLVLSGLKWAKNPNRIYSDSVGSYPFKIPLSSSGDSLRREKNHPKGEGVGVLDTVSAVERTCQSLKQTA